MDRDILCPFSPFVSLSPKIVLYLFAVQLFSFASTNGGWGPGLLVKSEPTLAKEAGDRRTCVKLKENRSNKGFFSVCFISSQNEIGSAFEWILFGFRIVLSRTEFLVFRLLSRALYKPRCLSSLFIPALSTFVALDYDPQYEYRWWKCPAQRWPRHGYGHTW